MTDKPPVISDTECYPNFWSIGFKRISDGKLVVMEKSARKELDLDRLANIMATHQTIGYNWIGYDLPMIAVALSGATNAQLKAANDKIILGRLKYWEVEEALGIRVPRDWTNIDLIEPQPNAFASLKTLQGRLHGRKMQDLPYSPDTALTEEQMDNVLAYMGNDLDATHNLWDALREPMELREALSTEYRQNFRSKSDSQIGEGIIKKRVEQLTGEKIERVNTPAGTSFPFKAPEYLRFERPELAEVLERLKTAEFVVQGNGKVELPDWLEGKTISIGESVYTMGIGGLHSTESNRAVHSDDDYELVDFDVSSYYPNIIINTGLYPKATGKAYTDVARSIVDDRLAAKTQMQKCDDDLKKLPADASATIAEIKAIRETAKVKAEGLKIAANGALFGKLGSVWSPLYAPHLMIATTLTGQLALLMLIEWAEAEGISVVSGNTDGVVFKIPREMMAPVEKTRVTDGPVKVLIERWEAATGFNMEAVPYRSIYNQSVNSYIAIKEDGKAKIKGPLANPWVEGDLRGQLMKNPQMTVVSKAVVALLTKGTPIADTVRACTDVKDFVTVVKVDGGALWKGEYLGKVVRYIWTRNNGAEIIRKVGHWKTGTQGKVSKTDGCRPLMDLPDDDALPADLDYDRYITEAEEILKDIGAVDRPPLIKPLRIFKWSAMAYFAVGV